MSRSQFYHIDAMIEETGTGRGTQPALSTSPTFSRPTEAPVLSLGAEASPILTSRPAFIKPTEAPVLSVTSISPTVSTVATRPTVTVPISDVVPVTVTIPTTPTYGGGGGGGAINTAKPATKEMMIQATKPSFIKRNWMPILLIGTAVFIFIKKPIK